MWYGQLLDLQVLLPGMILQVIRRGKRNEKNIISVDVSDDINSICT